MKNTFIVLAFLALTPFVTFGAQEMLTQQSVKAEYKSQVRTIDEQIKELEEATYSVDKTNQGGEFAQSYYDYLVAQNKIAKLNEQKRILDVSYGLLVNSFK